MFFYPPTVLFLYNSVLLKKQNACTKHNIGTIDKG